DERSDVALRWSELRARQDRASVDLKLSVSRRRRRAMRDALRQLVRSSPRRRHLLQVEARQSGAPLLFARLANGIFPALHPRPENPWRAALADRRRDLLPVGGAGCAARLPRTARRAARNP